MAKLNKDHVRSVMDFAKCDEGLAKRALKSTQGKHWTQAVIYAKEELAILTVPTGPVITAQNLADAWS